MCKTVRFFNARFINSQKCWKTKKKPTQKVGLNFGIRLRWCLIALKAQSVDIKYLSENAVATARCSNFLIVRFARNNEIWQPQHRALTTNNQT